MPRPRSEVLGGHDGTGRGATHAATQQQCASLALPIGGNPLTVLTDHVLPSTRPGTCSRGRACADDELGRGCAACCEVQCQRGRPTPRRAPQPPSPSGARQVRRRASRIAAVPEIWRCTSTATTNARSFSSSLEWTPAPSQRSAATSRRACATWSRVWTPRPQTSSGGQCAPHAPNSTRCRPCRPTDRGPGGGSGRGALHAESRSPFVRQRRRESDGRAWLREDVPHLRPDTLVQRHPAPQVCGHRGGRRRQLVTACRLCSSRGRPAQPRHNAHGAMAAVFTVQEVPGRPEGLSAADGQARRTTACELALSAPVGQTAALEAWPSCRPRLHAH